MNGNINMMNMGGVNMSVAGLKGNQQAMNTNMMPNANFGNSLVNQPRQNPGQGSQQKVFGDHNQQANPMTFATHQQRMSMNPQMGQVNGQVNNNVMSQMGGQVNGQMNPQMNPQMNQQMNQQMNHQMGNQMGNHMNGQMAGQMNGVVQLSPQQMMAQQPPQHPQQTHRPGIQRSVTASQLNNVNQIPSGKVTNQLNSNPMMSAPNSAPLPNSNNSAGNSRGHTPQMGNQSQPLPYNSQLHQQAAGQKINGGVPNNVTPIIPQQQQPTPQSQPRAGPNPPNAKAGIPTMPSQAPGGIQSNSQKQHIMPNPTGPPNVKNMEQEQFQNELNARIYKRSIGNAAVLRIMDLIDQVSNESIEVLSLMDYWKRVYSVYFLPTSTFRFKNAAMNMGNLGNMSHHGVMNGLNTGNHNVGPNSSNKTMASELGHLNGAAGSFELNASSAPRFFVSLMKSGNLSNFTSSLSNVRYQVMNNGYIIIVAKMKMSYYYLDGSIANITANFKASVNREFKIDWLDMHCSHYSTSLSFSALESKFRSYRESEASDPSRSSSSNEDFMSHLYKNSLATKYSGNSGMGTEAVRIMQTADIITSLKSLMEFSTSNNVSSPLKAFELYSAANNQQMSMVPQGSQIPQFPPPHHNNIGHTSSPSPHTIHGDPNLAKKRKASMASSAASPMTMDSIPVNKRRK